MLTLTFTDSPHAPASGVVYAADIWHISCAVTEYLRRHGLEGHGLSPVAHEALDLLGRFNLPFGVWEGQNEYLWDTDDFPKYLPHFHDPETCAGCGDTIESR